jgi:hypothetical protein
MKLSLSQKGAIYTKMPLNVNQAVKGFTPKNGGV